MSFKFNIPTSEILNCITLRSGHEWCHLIYLAIGSHTTTKHTKARTTSTYIP